MAALSAGDPTVEKGEFLMFTSDLHLCSVAGLLVKLSKPVMLGAA